MLPIWGVLQIEITGGHFLTWLAGFLVRRDVKRSVIGRDISILLGSGEVNAFVVIMYVVCGEE